MNQLNFAESRFDKYFNGNGSRDAAYGMAKAFRAMQDELMADAIVMFSNQKWVEGPREEIYRRAVSAHQGKNSKSGRLFEELVRTGYERFLNPWTVDAQQKVRLGKRDIDLYFQLPSGHLFTSITTQPRERKDYTWPEEYELVVQQMKRRAKSKKKFIFLGICGGGAKKTTEEWNTNYVQQMQDKLFLGKQGVVVAVKAIEHHAKVLQYILSELT